MKLMLICSKAFYDKIPPIQEELENNGIEVVLPNSYDNPNQEYEIMDMSAEEHAKWKGEKFRESEEKIKSLDAVLTLNYEKKGIPNYIGGATFLEMYDSWRHGKTIYVFNDLPKNLEDELKGFMPIIINRDLRRIYGDSS